MRVMVALENRFLKSQNGNIYSTTVCDYNFFSRYLQVFDSVLVFARVSETREQALNRPKANGPGVSFIELPTFIGPWQFLKHYRQSTKLAKHAITQADAFILRTPGTVAALLWQCLKRKGIPYSVEVVGDPWDTFGPGGVKSILRPFVRRKMASMLVRQCRFASTAAYVTEYCLQKRYPPGCWSTHYSSIELPAAAIVDEQKMKVRLEQIRDKAKSGKPWRICFVGSLWHLAKSPDILITTVADCIKRGLKLELVVVGGGCYQPELEKMAQDLGITSHVNFLGQLDPGEKVFHQMDQADLYVLPSRQEGLPRSVIEAMARGLPCITSSVGGIPELLPDEAMVEPRDVTGLVEKIMLLIGNPEKLRQMAVRNLEKAKEYRSKELNKRRVEFYKKVAEATKACHAS